MTAEHNDPLITHAGGTAEALELLRSALDRERIGVAIYLPIDGEDDYLHVYVNPAYEAHKPYVPMEGRRYREVWPDVSETVLPLFRNVLQTGEPWVAESQPFDVETAEGAHETRYFTYDVARLELLGRPFLLSTSTEVTGEVESRQELAHTRRRLEEILGRITDAFYAVDEEWRFTLVSPQAERLLHRRSEDLVGRVLWDEFPETLGSALEEHYRRAVAKQQTEVFRFYYPPLETWFDVRAFPSASGVSVFFAGVTEQVQAEQARELSEERYRAFVQASSDVVYLTTPDWTELKQLWGGEFLPSSEGASGDWLAHYVPADDIDSVRTAIQEAIDRKSTYECEHRVVRTDGSEGWTLSRAIPVIDEDGDVREWFGTAKDITDRKRLEHEAAESRRQLEEVLGRITDALYSLDTEWRFTLVSPQAERMLGKSRDELLGRVVWDVFPDAAESMGRRRFEHAMREQQPVSYRERLPSVGTWFDVRAYPSPTGLSVFFADVTEAVEAEQRLEAALDEARFLSGILQASSQPFAYGLPDGRLKIVNRAFEELTGYSEEELLGLEAAWSETLTPPEWRENEAQTLEVLRHTGLPQRYEKEYVRKDGSRVWVDMLVHMVIGEYGQEEAYYAFVSDISERKALERRARRESRRLTTVLDTLPVGVFVIDKDGTVPYTNSETERIWAGTPTVSSADEYGLYKGWWADTGARLRAEDWAAARALKGETSIGEVIDIERFDGTRGTILNSATPLRDSEGSIEGAVVVIQDLTQRRELERQLREAGRYSEALNEVNDEISSTLELDEILGAVLDSAAQAVDADVGAVWMPTGESWQARFTYQAPEWMHGLRIDHERIPFSMEAAENRRVMLWHEPERHPKWANSIARSAGAREVLDAPLMLDGGEVADMTLFKVDKNSRPFTDGDRDFLQKTSISVSLAMQNALRYERERSVSATLQDTLLTLPGEVPGIDFAHAYHSATETARVGGDFYDLFEIDGRLLGVLIGDVAGKGLSASVLTALTKDTVKAYAIEKGAAPAEILTLANEVLYRSSPESGFVTVLFAVLDRHSGRLLYANGGHTTGACVRADGAFQELRQTGPVIGAFPGMQFAEVEMRLDPCDSLFLYTDGLVEARNNGDLFGDSRLFEMLATTSGDEPETVVRRVIQSVFSFGGENLDDDLAILALRRLEHADEAPAAKKVEL